MDNLLKNHILMHESEHARRRHPFIQWLALLNRALFWFHLSRGGWSTIFPLWPKKPATTLCWREDMILVHIPKCLIDMARLVTRSGVRLNIAGLAMPGSALPRRIRRILEGGSVPHVSRTRMASVCVAFAISCTAIASGTLDHAQPNSSAERGMIPGGLHLTNIPPRNSY